MVQAAAATASLTASDGAPGRLSVIQDGGARTHLKLRTQERLQRFIQS